MKHQSDRRPAIFTVNNPTAPRLCPELAKEIGLNESLLFLQLEFWLRQSGSLQEDGQYWIYESVTDVQEVFTFWSRATINRIIHSLIEKDLLQVGNYNKHKYDRTRWFTLCRKGIEQLQSVRIGEWWVSQNETASITSNQNDTRSNQNETCTAQNGTTIPDLSSDLSSEKEPALPDSPPVIDASHLTQADIEAQIAEYELGAGISSKEFLRQVEAGIFPDTFEVMAWQILLEYRTPLPDSPDDNSLDDTPLPRMPPQGRTTVQATLRVRGDGKPREDDLRFDELSIPRESGASDSITEEFPTLYLTDAPPGTAPAVDAEGRPYWPDNSFFSPNDRPYKYNTTNDKTTAEEFKGRHAHTIDGLVREVEEKRAAEVHPDMTDPERDADPWADKPLLGFKALIMTPTLSPSDKRSWPKAFKKWAASWEDKAPTPDETYECIKGIKQSEYDWMTFKTPFGDSFKQIMNIMLGRLRGGQPWNAEGKRNGGSGENVAVPDLELKAVFSRLFDENGMRIEQ